MTREKANWIGHVLRRHCLLKHFIEGEAAGKAEWRERRSRRVSSYWMTLSIRESWNFKEKVLARALWRTCFRNGCRPVATQTTERRLERMKVKQYSYVTYTKVTPVQFITVYLCHRLFVNTINNRILMNPNN